jgi:hypothetical protein
MEAVTSPDGRLAASATAGEAMAIAAAGGAVSSQPTSRNDSVRVVAVGRSKRLLNAIMECGLPLPQAEVEYDSMAATCDEEERGYGKLETFESNYFSKATSSGGFPVGEYLREFGVQKAFKVWLEQWDPTLEKHRAPRNGQKKREAAAQAAAQAAQAAQAQLEFEAQEAKLRDTEARLKTLESKFASVAAKEGCIVATLLQKDCCKLEDVIDLYRMFASAAAASPHELLDYLQDMVAITSAWVTYTHVVSKEARDPVKLATRLNDKLKGEMDRLEGVVEALDGAVVTAALHHMEDFEADRVAQQVCAASLHVYGAYVSDLVGMPRKHWAWPLQKREP